MKKFQKFFDRPIVVLLVLSLFLGSIILLPIQTRAFYLPSFSFGVGLPGFTSDGMPLGLKEVESIIPVSKKSFSFPNQNLDPFSKDFNPLGDDFFTKLDQEINRAIETEKKQHFENHESDFSHGKHDFQFSHDKKGNFDHSFEKFHDFQSPAFNFDFSHQRHRFTPQNPEVHPEPPVQDESPQKNENHDEKTSSEAEKLKNEVVAQTNQIRRQNGLNTLTVDSLLTRAAQRHAEDMAKNNYFSHTSQDGRAPADRIRNAGYQSTCSAENIAYGQKTPEIVMQDWINSEGHRKNILWEPIKEIGVGVASDEEGRIYWVQNFGCGK